MTKCYWLIDLFIIPYTNGKWVLAFWHTIHGMIMQQLVLRGGSN